MTSLSDLVTIVLVGSESAFGIVINVFIMAVLIPDWVKNKTLNASYLILVFLSVSNLCFVCTTNTDFIFGSLAASVYYSAIFYRIVYMCWFVTNIFNSWLTACLCISYCVKIVEIQHPIFFQLKLRISKMTPWMILASFFLSSILSFPVYSDIILHVPPNSTASGTGFLTVDWSVPYTVTISVLGAGLPLLLVVFSLTLTLWSLCKHMRQMQKNATDFSPPQVEAHVGASRTMICLLTMYVCFCTANIVTMLLYTVHIRALHNVCLVVVMSYPLAQPFILVLGNSNLKKTLMRVIYCPHCV